jgi:hypothetical protein
MSTLKTTRARRKPFDVETVRVTADNMVEVAAWSGGSIHSTIPPQGGLGLKTQVKRFIKIEVPNASSERQKKAYIGDWVLKAENGSIKIYTNEAYHKSFDELGDPPCGLTLYTLDKGPCVLSVHHREIKGYHVGCRSFNDYSLIARTLIQPEWQQHDNGPAREASCM